MKKEKILFMFILSVIGISFSSAAPGISGTVANASAGIAQIISAMFGPFFGALLASQPEYLFEHILIFLVIFCGTFMGAQQVKTINGNKAVVLIISLSVSILAARFMSVPLIISILLPYQAVGIVISALLPLMIGFFFTHYGLEEFPILRKIFWIFFTVVFVALWGDTYNEAGAAGWIYFWTAVIALLFFLFDGTIRRAILKQRMVEAGVDSNKKFAIHIRRELQDLNEDLRRGIITQPEYDEIKREKLKHLKSLSKY